MPPSLLFAPVVAMTLLASPASLYDFSVKTIDGKDVSLAQYKGKALVVVNTASQCGYTPQYRGLEALYRKYQARGLVVLAFPSNDFGGQEPGTNADIKAFCELRFKTTFPLFAKVQVTGAGAHPLYRHLVGLPEHGGEVTWNFNKFLVSPEGQVVAHLPSDADPASEDFQRRIEALLPAR